MEEEVVVVVEEEEEKAKAHSYIEATVHIQIQLQQHQCESTHMMLIEQQFCVLIGKDGLVNTHTQLQNIQKFITLRDLTTLWFNTKC